MNKETSDLLMHSPLVVIGAVEHADVRLVFKLLRRDGGRCVEAVVIFPALQNPTPDNRIRQIAILLTP